MDVAWKIVVYQPNEIKNRITQEHSYRPLGLLLRACILHFPETPLPIYDTIIGELTSRFVDFQIIATNFK